MLAITHHWILQLCQTLVLIDRISEQKALHPNRTDLECRALASASMDYEPWLTKYEILGDDLVILDSAIATKYLEVAKDLGVEINLSKSILSTNGSFEFAKRTVIQGTDVSGVCWKQFIGYGSMATVTNTMLSLLEAGKLNLRNLGLIKSLASRVGLLYSTSQLSKKMAERRLKLVLIAMLGSFAEKGKVPLSWLAQGMLNPGQDIRKENLLPPIEQTLKYLKQVSEESPIARS
jgi:hypothetical protein